MNKLKLFFLPITLALAACGKEVTVDHKPSSSQTRSYEAPKVLKETAEEFFQACENQGVTCSVYHLSMRIGDTGELAGFCKVEWLNGRIRQTITIRPDYVFHKQVIFHELLHCTRFQEHTEGNMPHVMRSYALNEGEWSERSQEDWLYEAFARDVRFPGWEND